jgi:hypothetical protein
MKFEDVLRESRRVQPDRTAVERWRRAVFSPEARPEARTVPRWIPSLASAAAMAGMLLLLWPAAARGPVALRAAGVACDGRWEQPMPLRADLRGVAQPIPARMAFAASDQCGLCHLSSVKQN